MDTAFQAHLTVKDFEDGLNDLLLDGMISDWQAKPLIDEEGRRIGIQLLLDISEDAKPDGRDAEPLRYVFTIIESETESTLTIRPALIDH